MGGSRNGCFQAAIYGTQPFIHTPWGNGSAPRKVVLAVIRACGVCEARVLAVPRNVRP